MIDFTRLPVSDVRLLAVIAAALITLAKLSPTDSYDKPPLVRIGSGEPGVQVTSLASSPTGKHVVTTNTSGRVSLRGEAGGWRIERRLEFPGYARSVAFSPDGRALAAAGLAPQICLWDMRAPNREPVRSIVLPIGQARCVMFSPDGQLLAVTTDLDGTIVVWDLDIERERMVLRSPSPVRSAAFSPDGRWLATGGRDDRSILLWNLKTGSREVLLADGLGPALALAFSPNGALVASASRSEHHVRLWDMNARRQRLVLNGHARPVNSVAFSPAGSLLATAGNDGMIGIWEVSTGRRRRNCPPGRRAFWPSRFPQMVGPSSWRPKMTTMYDCGILPNSSERMSGMQRGSARSALRLIQTLYSVGTLGATHRPRALGAVPHAGWRCRRRCVRGSRRSARSDGPLGLSPDAQGLARCGRRLSGGISDPGSPGGVDRAAGEAGRLAAWGRRAGRPVNPSAGLLESVSGKGG